MKKNFRKYLEDILKSFYLCIRFPEKKADIKEAIFEEIYINNTSSTSKKIEPSILVRESSDTIEDNRYLNKVNKFTAS